MDICVDHYLWVLYQRTVKVDTNKVHEWRKVTAQEKCKTVTVSKRFTKLVDEDFTWKDPKGGGKGRHADNGLRDRGHGSGLQAEAIARVRAARRPGLSPGITSGFRDDYRQSIASGLKAASNRSFHGGSLRGGYGHGARSMW